MPLFRQLEFAVRTIASPQCDAARFAQRSGYSTADLQEIARELLRANGADRIAPELRVEWNSRLKTTAGRVDYRRRLISLNPQLVHHPAEIDRTLLHELAHLLAQFRAGHRRILPHGAEWREACNELGIANEKRCHNLSFPASKRARRYLYKCPNCQRGFPRVRRIRRAVACLACCRRYNGGEFNARFRLILMRRDAGQFRSPDTAASTTM